MSSKICPVIFLFNRDGPAQRTSLRLNVSPASKRKKIKISTMVTWLMNPMAPMESALKKSPSLNCGLVNDHMGRRLLGHRRNIRRLAGRLINLSRGGLHFLHGVGLPLAACSQER